MLSAFLLRRRRPSARQPVSHAPRPAGWAAIAPAAAPLPVSTAELARIAQASVQLAALGPQLASLAAGLETQAKAQARRAESIAATTDALTQDLERAVGELRASAGAMESTLRTVERIAQHTRILSLSASIEAARAGEAGRAFAVVVDEVKRLADDSGQNTRSIQQRMQEIDTSISRVAAVTLDGAELREAQTARTVAAVNQEVRGMAGSAGLQLDGAASVHAMGDRVSALTESLLLAVGRFRFEAHARAEAAVQPLLAEFAGSLGDRPHLETTIARWLESQPYFELAYITDARGRQIVDNLVCRAGTVTHDRRGFGRDWSDRPWYRDALQHHGVSSTDVYRSSATGDFCFTIAAALRGSTGELLGVFGSDVNFQRLVSA